MNYNDLEYVKGFRKTNSDIEPYILRRWSPRSLTGESITNKELMSLFEAARWAPSSFNGQPWHFLYATRDSENWSLFFNLMGEFNQTWTKNAAVLLVVLSRNNFEYNDEPNYNHSFDTGSAWENLALQANAMGLVAHGMAGFDHDKTKIDLKVPDSYTIEAMVAIGRPDKKEKLPLEIQKSEQPNDRKKVSEFIREGTFSFDK